MNELAYLSRIRLNVKRRRTQEALYNPNIFHGAIERALCSETRSRALWRVDVLHDNYYLLIVSHTLLDLSILADQFGYSEDPGEWKVYSPFLEKLEPNQNWHFKVCCSPTKAALEDEQKDKKRGKVVALVKQADIENWMIRKGEHHGFSVDRGSLQIVQSKWIQMRNYKKKAKVTFYSVTLEGYLTVTDADLFRKVLTDGIGKEKAYGQGLLTIVKGNQNG